MRTPPKNRLDLTGTVYGRLTVTSEGERQNKQRRWYCQCECGNTVLVLQSSLRGGLTSSCGCLHKEFVSDLKATHKLTGTPEHRAWQGMKTRCNNPNSISYPLYGGRGIKVCDRWLNDFPAFLEDMGPRPSSAHSLDRIDNSKDYEPTNCRWATDKEQGRNKRNNHYLTYNGETLTVVEWAERIGIPEKVLRHRVNRSKWTDEQAITTPYVAKK